MIGCAVEFTVPLNGRYRGLCFDVRHGVAYVVVLGHPFVYQCDPSTLLIVNPTYTAAHHRPQSNGRPTPCLDDSPINIHRIH